jgi:zinc transport system permease protein
MGSPTGFWENTVAGRVNMTELLQQEFLRNALYAGLLAGLLCGVIGSLVVVNGVVFLAGGLAHGAYGGIGLAYFLGYPPLAGAAAFSVGLSAVMAWMTLHDRRRVDTVIGVLWATGMAVGIILLDLTPGYHPDLMSYLFGSILAVPAEDLKIMAAVTAVVILLTVSFYRPLEALSYDRDYARTRGIPVGPLYFLLLALVALSVVLVISVVGLILVIALLSIPPYIAEKFSRSLWGMMIRATVLSLLFTVSGLLLAFRFNLTSGAAVIVVAAAAFFLSLPFRR